MRSELAIPVQCCAGTSAHQLRTRTVGNERRQTTKLNWISRAMFMHTYTQLNTGKSRLHKTSANGYRQTLFVAHNLFPSEDDDTHCLRSHNLHSPGPNVRVSLQRANKPTAKRCQLSAPIPHACEQKSLGGRVNSGDRACSHDSAA